MLISKENAKTLMVVAVFLAVVVSSVFLVMYWVLSSSFVIDETVSLVETVCDHDLPKPRHAYRHSGKPELVSTSTSDEEDAEARRVRSVWFKVFDKEKESQKSWWTKFKEGLFSEDPPDEKNALIFTDKKYREKDELSPGNYVYIAMLLIETDFKVLGTYIREVPVFVEAEIYPQVDISEKSLIKHIREIMVSTVAPGESYKLEKTKRGAVLTRTFVKVRVEVKDGGRE